MESGPTALVLPARVSHPAQPSRLMLKLLGCRRYMVTCKSATPSRITDNTQIFDFTLNDSQMEQLNALECGFRVTPSTVKDIAVRGRYYKDMP